MLAGCAPCDLYCFDLCGWRPLSQLVQEVFERGPWSLCDHLNVAIAFVAHIATQAQPLGLLDHKIAEAHPLYTSRDHSV